MEAPIEYDKFGRMKYHPDYHTNNGKPWSTEDLQYLKDWYYKIGPEEMSFALGRTISTVMHMAYKLTKEEIITRPGKRPHRKRIGKDE